uniref:short transient receptor potential channel 4-like isoform X1 n=1 Tax=Styela clava TaxID=7725 RepID=UPI001939C838|nr:short transient receptor potential channel 4-like isoform X1 [Styela clava]
MNNQQKLRRDTAPGSAMMAMVVKMAQQAELPRESPTFTRLPNFRHTGPPGPPSPNAYNTQSLNLPSSSGTQRRSSFGLGSLFSTPLARRKNNSSPLSVDSVHPSPLSSKRFPIDAEDTPYLSDEIRHRIKELSARTKLKQKGDPTRNTNNCASNKNQASTNNDPRTNAIPGGTSANSSRQSSNRDYSTNGVLTRTLTKMTSNDSNANRRMNTPRIIGQTNRRLPGVGNNSYSNDENPIFGVSSVTIPHIEEEGYLNNYELNFLRYAAEGDLKEVKQIFEEQTYYLFHLDVNCVDSLDRTALSLALLNRHIDVVRFLLSDEVVGIELRDALFYAIECEFYEAIEMLLEKDSQTSVQIVPGTTSPFEPGLTPIMLSANKNNYKILTMLYKFNHRLTVNDKEILDDSFDTYSWDAVMERLLHFRARASPAFMLLMYNEKGMAWDPLNTAMDLFGELQMLAKREREVDEAYLQMAEQCETFALQLLQEVRSASELADLMRYDLDADPDEDDDPGETDRVIIRKREKMRNYLKPIEKAIKYKMKDFVTSDNSQLALIYIQKGSLFRKLKGYKAFLAQVLLGLLFPFLSIGFLVAPDTKFGRLMRNPTVKFACSVVSEVVFVIMLLANTILTQIRTSQQRDEIPPLLIIAYAWIIGKLVQELREMIHQGLREYLSDVWNWNDMFTILLFTGYMVLRLLNKVMQDQAGVGNHFYWVPVVLDPVPLSDVCISIAYILIHLRILELLRADRRFGPLQVSLDLMTRDAIRFLVIFFIIYLAFGSGITELYAPFGESKGCYCDMKKCNPKTMTTIATLTSDNSSTTSTIATGQMPEECIPCKDTNDEQEMVITTLQGIFTSMFWTLFGYSQVFKDNMGTDCPDNEYLFTEVVGTIIICMYHIIAIIVLVNMLIAMMSNSFQKTHDDAEREWKFHRTQLWLKFIRNEINRPPPMNLIPRPKQIRQLANKLMKKFQSCGRGEDTNTIEEDGRLQNQIRMQRRRTGFDSNQGRCLAGSWNEGETRYSKVLRLVVIRYLKKKVLNSEMVI